MYYLKLFDKTLITFKMEMDLYLKIYDINVILKDKKLFPEMLQDKINSETIEEFLKQRIIPKNRAFVRQILESQNLNIKDTKGIIDICKGLSLNDSYWIVDDEKMKFSDYNLYENDFSKTISLIAFTGYTSKIKGIATSPEFTTNGMLPKAWRKIDNKVYLYKGSTQSWGISNTGYEPYSEFYASQLAKNMGIDCIEYDLKKWKNNLVSTCPLFTSKDYSYVPIWLASKSDKINDIYKWCCENGFKEDFGNMIIFDSLIYNPDRHLGNFGVIKDNNTGEYVKFAPIFDNGEGLFAKGDIKAFESKENMEEYLSKESVNISSYGVDFRRLVKEFCTQSQIAKLRKVFNFTFQKHPSYNLSDKRLKIINNVINNRARELVLVIENSIQKQKEKLVENSINEDEENEI